MEQNVFADQGGKHGAHITAKLTPVRDKYVGRRRRQPWRRVVPFGLVSRFRQHLSGSGGAA